MGCFVYLHALGFRSTQWVTLEMGQVVTRMAASLRVSSWEEQKYKKRRKILPVGRDEGQLFVYFFYNDDREITANKI